MHYYVQIEFKNAFHFMYKERYIPEEEEYIFHIYHKVVFQSHLRAESIFWANGHYH